MTVYQKGNMWKVSGSSKKYKTKEEALANNGSITEEPSHGQNHHDEHEELFESSDTSVFGVAGDFSDPEPDSSDQCPE
jgi:hypothetical protein